MHKKLIPIYVCDYCNKEFDSEYLCEIHEKDKHICPICEHSYYVYGCEFNCELQNEGKRCRFKKKEDE